MAGDVARSVRSRTVEGSIAGGVGVLGLVALSGVAVAAGLWKVLAVAWVAFFAMAGAAALGGGDGVSTDAGRLVWGYGLASGAMVTSAAVFLVPQAVGYDPSVGGFGVAGGLLAGFGAHTVGHRLSHMEFPGDDAVVQLTAHALSAGLIIGVVYATMPEVGLLLGLAIVSHKGPAGYAAARRLATDGRPVRVLLLPAAGVGLTAIPAGFLDLPNPPLLNAAVFGFAAGVFLHVAMDFLPRCEVGGDVYEVATADEDAHALLDRLRLHAVGSTALGGLAVLVAWLALQA